MEELGRSKVHNRRRGAGARAAMVVALIVVFLMSAASLTLSILDVVGVIGDKKTTTVVSNGGYYEGNNATFAEGSIADVASKVAPSVVSIVTQTESRGYFRNSTSSAAGTGMIVTSDGYILTNKHVVDGATKVTVVMDDGETYEDVKVVGVDPLNDVAFLKISGVKDLPAVTLGDSKSVMIGQPVIAVGNALGQYQNTITQGIISGTGRSITASDGSGSYENLSDMIQTDASINHGNSGGPLVNAAGHVIGINTAVSEDANGIGFAIPISSVKGMLGHLIESGKVERAYVGVNYLPITPDVVREYDLPVKAGAYIYSETGSPIMVGSPAEKAGLKNKDIVIAVNDVNLGANGSLASLIAEYKVGDTVQLKVLRGGDEVLIDMKLAAYPK